MPVCHSCLPRRNTRPRSSSPILALHVPSTALCTEGSWSPVRAAPQDSARLRPTCTKNKRAPSNPCELRIARGTQTGACRTRTRTSRISMPISMCVRSIFQFLVPSIPLDHPSLSAPPSAFDVPFGVGCPHGELRKTKYPEVRGRGGHGNPFCFARGPAHISRCISTRGRARRLQGHQPSNALPAFSLPPSRQRSVCVLVVYFLGHRACHGACTIVASVCKGPK